MNQGQEPIRVGLVGTGGIARAHSDNIRANEQSVLVGGVDVSPEAREGFSEEYDVPMFGTYEELRDHGVDAIIITTPNAFHADYAVAALDDGVHVLCEKPLADTLENAERIVEAAERSEAIAMVGFNNRFSAPSELVNDAITEGRLGDPVHVEARWIRRRGIPGRGGWFTREEMSGGGAMIDIGVHVLDLALYLLGNPQIEEVSAVSRAHFGGRDDYTYAEMWGQDNGPEGFNVDDSVTALIRCAGGKTVSLDAAWAINRNDDSTVTVVGTESGAEFDIKENDVRFYDVDRSSDAENPLPTPVYNGDDRNGHAEELAYFLRVINGECEFTRNTVQQGLDIQRVIDAIYESSETGQAVPLQPRSRATVDDGSAMEMAD